MVGAYTSVHAARRIPWEMASALGGFVGTDSAACFRLAALAVKAVSRHLPRWHCIRDDWYLSHLASTQRARMPRFRLRPSAWLRTSNSNPMPGAIMWPLAAFVLLTIFLLNLRRH